MTALVAFSDSVLLTRLNNTVVICISKTYCNLRNADQSGHV